MAFHRFFTHVTCFQRVTLVKLLLSGSVSFSVSYSFSVVPSFWVDTLWRPLPGSTSMTVKPCSLLRSCSSSSCFRYHLEPRVGDYSRTRRETHSLLFSRLAGYPRAGSYLRYGAARLMACRFFYAIRRSLTSSCSTKQRPHDAPLLAYSQGEAILLPALLRKKSRLRALLFPARSFPRLRSTGQTPHSVHFLAPLREDAALLPAWPFQRSCVHSYLWAYRSLTRLRSARSSDYSSRPGRQDVFLAPQM